MAGLGALWDPNLHPRGWHGRFIKKFKLAPWLDSVIKNFKPRTFQTDGQAAQFNFNMASKRRFNELEMRRVRMDWDEASDHIRNNDIDPSTKQFMDIMDSHMAPTPEGLILGRTFTPEALGLRPEQLNENDPQGIIRFMGNTIADKTYSPTHLGSDGSHGAGKITMRIAVPPGVRVAHLGENRNDRGVALDKGQRVLVTRVYPDQQGGWYMTAVAEPPDAQKAPRIPRNMESLVEGRKGPGLTPEQREARIGGRSVFQQPAEPPVPSSSDVAIQRGARVNPATPSPTAVEPAQVPERTPAQQAAKATRRAGYQQARAAEGGAPSGVGERTEAVHAPAIGGTPTEGRSASEIAQQTEAAPAAPAAPAPVRRPLREVFQEAGLKSPSAGPQRREFNNALMGTGDPNDHLRELDADIEANKARLKDMGFEEPRAKQLATNVTRQEALAKLMTEHYGLARAHRTPEATAPEAPEAVTPEPEAPKPAGKFTTVKQLTGDERSAYDGLNTQEKARYLARRRAGQDHGTALSGIEAKKAAPAPVKKAVPEKATPAPAKVAKAVPVSQTEKNAAAAARRAETGEQKPTVNPVQMKTGDKVLVRKNNAGEWVRTTTKTGATPLTVDRVESGIGMASQGGRRTRRGYILHGTGPDGERISTVAHAGNTAFKRHEEKAPRVTKAAKAAAPKAEAPAKAAPVKKAAKAAAPSVAKAAPAAKAVSEVQTRADEAGLPKTVTALRQAAREKKIRGFSTMNKEQLQRALLGEEVGTGGKLGAIAPGPLTPHLKAAKTDQAARNLLDEHTVADLKALAKHNDVNLKGITTKDKIKDAIIKHLRGEEESGLRPGVPTESLSDTLAKRVGNIPEGADFTDLRSRIAEANLRPNDPDSLRQHRDDLEAMSKEFEKADPRVSRLAQKAADVMGMRAQEISGVEEAPEPVKAVKKVAKKAAVKKLSVHQERIRKQHIADGMDEEEARALAEEAPVRAPAGTKAATAKRVAAKKVAGLPTTREEGAPGPKLTAPKRAAKAAPRGLAREGIGGPTGQAREGGLGPNLTPQQKLEALGPGGRTTPRAPKVSESDIERAFKEAGIPGNAGGLRDDAKLSGQQGESPQAIAKSLRRSADQIVENNKNAPKSTDPHINEAATREAEANAAKVRKAADLIEGGPGAAPARKLVRGKIRSTDIVPGDRVMVERDSEGNLVPEMVRGDGAAFPADVIRRNDDGSLHIRDEAGNEVDTVAPKKSGHFWRPETPTEARRAAKKAGQASAPAPARAAPSLSQLERQAIDNLSPDLQKAYWERRGTGLTHEQAIAFLGPKEATKAAPRTPAQKAVGRKVVPKGAVPGERAQAPIANKPRANEFDQAMEKANIPKAPDRTSQKSMDEVRRSVSRGDYSPEEGIRRLEADIEINRDEINDIHRTIRRGGVTEPEAAKLRDQVNKLENSVVAQEHMSRAMHQHFGKERVTAPEVLEQVKQTHGQGWWDNLNKDVNPDEFRKDLADNPELAELGPFKGDNAQEIFQDALQKVIKRERGRRAAKKAAPAKVAKKAARAVPEPNPDFAPGGAKHLDAKAIAGDLNVDQSVLDDVQGQLNAGKTPGQVSKHLRDRAKVMLDFGTIRNTPDLVGKDSPEYAKEKAADLADVRERHSKMEQLADRLATARRPIVRKAAPTKPTMAENNEAKEAAKATGTPVKEVRQRQTALKQAEAAAKEAGLKTEADNLKARIIDRHQKAWDAATTRQEAEAATTAMRQDLTLPEIREWAKPQGITGRSKEDILRKAVDRRFNVPEQRAEKISAVNNRMAKGQQVSHIAQIISDINEMQNNQASEGALRNRVRARVAHSNQRPGGISEDLASRLETAAINKDEGELFKIEGEHGITRNTGNIGDIEPYDPTRHQAATTESIRKGQAVRLFSVGHQGNVEGRAFQANKASVMKATPEEHQAMLERLGQQRREEIQNLPAETRAAVLARLARRPAPTQRKAALARRAEPEVTPTREEEVAANMARLNTARNMEKLTPGHRAVIDGLTPEERDLYWQRRGEGQDHATAISGLGRAVAAKKAVAPAAPEPVKAVKKVAPVAKATPAKAIRPPSPSSGRLSQARLVEELGKATSTKEGDRLIATHLPQSKAQYRALAEKVGVETGPKDTMAQMHSAILRQAVTRRLEHEAYLRLAQPASIEMPGRPVKSASIRDFGQNMPLKLGREAGDEKLKLPNGGADQGIVHMDSTIGQLWQDLASDDRTKNSTLNKVIEIGDDLGRGRIDLPTARALIRDIKPGDSALRDRINKAVADLDVKPASYAIPGNTPKAVRDWLDEINQIPAFHNKAPGQAGERGPTPFEKIVQMVRDIGEGKTGPRGDTELLGAGQGPHESGDGIYQSRKEAAKLFFPGNQSPEIRQWFRSWRNKEQTPAAAKVTANEVSQALREANARDLKVAKARAKADEIGTPGAKKLADQYEKGYLTDEDIERELDNEARTAAHESSPERARPHTPAAPVKKAAPAKKVTGTTRPDVSTWTDRQISLAYTEAIKDPGKNRALISAIKAERARRGTDLAGINRRNEEAVKARNIAEAARTGTPRLGEAEFGEPAKKAAPAKAAKKTAAKVTQAELRSPVAKVGAEAPKATTSNVTAHGLTPGEGIPVSNFLALQNKLGSARAADLRKLDRYARVPGDYNKIPDLYRQILQQLQQAGVGPNDPVRQQFEKWFKDHFS